METPPAPVVGSGVADTDTLMINAGTAVQVIELQDEPRPFNRETANRYLFELGVAGQTFAIGALNSAGHSLRMVARVNGSVAESCRI